MAEHEQWTSLLDAWLGYETYVLATQPSKKADATLAQVRTALLRYTLPAWGFPLPKGQRLTSEECKQGLQFFSQIRLVRLQEAPALQEKLFEQMGVAGNSRRNYRWALNRFMGWCQQQPWPESIPWAEEQQADSRHQAKKGSAADVRLTTRKSKSSYRLAESEISNTLRQELQAFQNFLTNSEETRPDKRRNSSFTAQKFSHYALRFLGWMHYEQGLLLKDLSLKALVPMTSRDTRAEDVPKTKASQSTVELVQAYLYWLEKFRSIDSNLTEQARISPHTVLQVINAWIEIVKFVSYQRTKTTEKYAQEEKFIIAVLHQLQKKARADLKSHRPVSDESKKMMTWRDFLALAESLRHECRPRLNYGIRAKEEEITQGSVRSLSAIAQSYQRFLCAALLSYIPPQRQQALRHLKFTLSTRADMHLRNEEDSPTKSVIFQSEDQWWLKIINDKSSNRTLSASPILIPNISYPNQQYFYKYLQEWLFQYEYQNEQGQSVVIPGLRSCFNPQHQYFFTLKNGEPYQSASAFTTLLRNPAYRLKGKVLTPHSIQKMFAIHIAAKQESIEVEQIANDLYGIPLLDPHTTEKTPTPTSIKNDQQWAAAIAQAFINESLLTRGPLEEVELGYPTFPNSSLLF